MGMKPDGCAPAPPAAKQVSATIRLLLEIILLSPMRRIRSFSSGNTIIARIGSAGLPAGTCRRHWVFHQRACQDDAQGSAMRWCQRWTNPYGPALQIQVDDLSSSRTLPRRALKREPASSRHGGVVCRRLVSVVRAVYTATNVWPRRAPAGFRIIITAGESAV